MEATLEPRAFGTEIQTLSCEREPSRAAEIDVHAGGRTLVAPADRATASVSGVDIDRA